MIFSIFLLQIEKQIELVSLLGMVMEHFVVMISFSTDYNSHPFLILIGDLNRDNRLDFAIVSNTSVSLQVFLQTY